MDHSMIDIKNIPFDDADTWKLIQSGYTCGMFQCESPLVQHWLKKIKPCNLWELSAVVAAVRPGVLKSGYAELYVKNKDAGEIESFGNEIVDQIFKGTHGVLLYQEHLMRLGARLAWPDLQEREKLIKVDQLRKAVGKKNQQKILEIGKEFVDGCTRNGVDTDLSAKLFEVIKNSGRYAFNLSHSFKYGAVGYITAYLKTHYPLQTIVTYFTYAKEKNQSKWDEIDKLAHEAKVFDIKLLPPNINKHNYNFRIENGAIRYGLGHLKFGISKKYYLDVVCNLPPIDSWHKFILLTFTNTYGEAMRANTVQALCATGAFSDTKMGRKSLISLYKLINELSPKELEVFIDKMAECESIADLPQFITTLFANKPAKRLEKIKSAVAFFATDWDHPAWIGQKEKEYLGTIITASSIDGKNIQTTDSCADCLANWPPRTIKSISAVVTAVIPRVTKRGSNPGQKMASISVADTSGKLENIPVFPEEFLLAEDLLIENNTIELCLEMGKTGWIAKQVKQIT